MSALTTIAIDVDKVSGFTAQLDSFGETLAEKSDKLIEYVETASVITKRLHLETESLRGVRESLKIAIIEALKEELKGSAVPLGNQLFSVFSSKATTFLDNQFSQVTRVNEDLKKTVRAWSNLSFKSISLLALTAVLIGVGSFFSSHYLMASRRLTGEEKKLLAFGRSLANNFNALKPEAQKLLKDGVYEWTRK
jgi:hypothetical protein